MKVSVIREWRKPFDPNYFNRNPTHFRVFRVFSITMLVLLFGIDSTDVTVFVIHEWREPCDPIFLMRNATHRRCLTLFLLMVFGFKIKGTGWRFPSFANDENLVTPIASSEMQPIVHEGVFRVFNLPACCGLASSTNSGKAPVGGAAIASTSGTSTIFCQFFFIF